MDNLSKEFIKKMNDVTDRSTLNLYSQCNDCIYKISEKWKSGKFYNDSHCQIYDEPGKSKPHALCVNDSTFICKFKKTLKKDK